MARDSNGRKDPNLWFAKPNARDGWELIPLYDHPAPRGGVTEAAELIETLLAYVRRERDELLASHCLLGEDGPIRRTLEEAMVDEIAEMERVIDAATVFVATPPAAQAQDAGPMARGK
jgi:hypothetical protein